MLPPEPLTKRRRWWGHNTIRDRTGEQRGRLTFLSWAGTGTRTGRVYWHVRCECGEQRIIRTDATTRSCGCLNEESLRRPGRFKRDGQYHNQVTVLVEGRQMSLTAAARHYGISMGTVKQRRASGWPPERWFEPPRLPYAKLKKWRRRKCRRPA